MESSSSEEREGEDGKYLDWNESDNKQKSDWNATLNVIKLFTQ